MSLWNYYFLDLPSFALGLPFRETSGFYKRIEGCDISENNINYLLNQMGEKVSARSTEEIRYLYHFVLLVRESDTYRSLLITKNNLFDWFSFSGLAHLEDARREEKDIIFIGSHMGSNYTLWIALGYLGYRIYPFARKTDRSASTPFARQIYMDTTYCLTRLKWPGNYIFTDTKGHLPRGQFDKKLDEIFLNNGIGYVAIDIPPSLYSGVQQQVNFLGKTSFLPSGVVRKALQRDAILLPVWDTIENEGKTIMRKIVIGPRFKNTTEEDIMQKYADQLTSLICDNPWQWMGLPIISQYHELP